MKNISDGLQPEDWERLKNNDEYWEKVQREKYEKDTWEQEEVDPVDTYAYRERCKRGL